MSIGQNTWAHVNCILVKTPQVGVQLSTLGVCGSSQMPRPSSYYLKGTSVVWLCNCSICFCITSEQQHIISWFQCKSGACVVAGFATDKWIYLIRPVSQCIAMCGHRTVVSTFPPRRHISRVHLRFPPEKCTGSYIIRIHSHKWMLVHEQIEDTWRRFV